MTNDDLAEESIGSGELTAVVGENLRRLRTRYGMSLERLAKASGVSRAMLGQIELGRSSPTINVLCKVARALDVPISFFVSQNSDAEIQIVRVHRARWLKSANGRFSSRSLTPQERAAREELSEVRLSPQTIEEEEPHALGSTEYVVLAKGTLELRYNNAWHRLERGDSASFPADRPHAYRNPSMEEAVFFVFKVAPNLNV